MLNRNLAGELYIMEPLPWPSKSTASGSVGRLIIAGLLLASAIVISLLSTDAHLVFTAHMLQHLVAMNCAAPFVALLLGNQKNAMILPAATLLQVAGLFFWHLPAVFVLAHHSATVNLLMQISLFAIAVVFWQAILGGGDRPVWPRIFALLITAKLFCLLGVAFVFSRRAFYPTIGKPEVWGLTALGDQQLAGLIMVSSCALIYVVAATVLFSIWLFGTKRSFTNVAADVAHSPR